MNPPTRRGCTRLVLAMAFLSGCRTWQPTTVSPRVLIAEEQPRLIRVTGPDGVPRVVAGPRIEGDAIVVAAECRRSPSPRGGYMCPTEAVLALNDVRDIEVRRVSAGRTALLLLVAAPVWVVAAAASEGFWDPNC